MGFLTRLFGNDSSVPKVGTALIVDDEAPMRELLEVHLKAMNYSIAKASSAAEARAQMQKGLSPALLVLDVMLPKEDGISFAKALRKDGMTARTPIVLVTGEIPASKMRQVIETIPNCDFLIKPISAKKLKESVDSLQPAPKRASSRRAAALPRR